MQKNPPSLFSKTASSKGKCADTLKLLSSSNILKGLTLAGACLLSPLAAQAGNSGVKLRAPSPTPFSYDSSDGRYHIELHGLVQANAVHFTGDDTNLDGGFSTRRAALHMHASFDKVWSMDIAYRFAVKELHSASIGYSGLWHQNLTVGQFNPSFGLTNSINTASLTFMEMPIGANAFSTGFYQGIGDSIHLNNTFTASAAVFGPGTGDNAPAGKRSLGESLRLTLSPIHKDNKVLHFGADVWHQGTNSTHQVSFSSDPGVEPPQRSQALVNTGTISDVKDYTIYGFEAATVYHAFSANAEAYWNRINRYVGNSNPHFNAYHIQASYFLTGESRKYSFVEGAFTGITPIRHDYGAVELAARIGRLDLQQSGVSGGDETNYTVGANWYFNQNVEWRVNYIKAQAHPSDNNIREDVNIFATQLQLNF